MLIPSQLPQFATPARPGALQALALKSGQVLDARIIGPALNGGTQVEVRGQLLNLMLPTAVAVGETIKLQVQGAGQQMRLALQLATAPAMSTPAGAPPAPPGPPLGVQLQSRTTVGPLPPSNGAPSAPAQAAGGQPPIAAPPASQLATVSPSSAGNPVPAAPATLSPTQNSSLPANGATTAHPGGAAPIASASTAAVASSTPPPAAIPAPPGAAPLGPLAAAVAAPGAVSPAPAAPSAVAAAVRPVMPTATAGSGTAFSSAGNPLPQSSPQPATPQAALAQMVHTALPRQGSVTALTSALVSIAGKVALPEPVARAAQQVLAGRLAVDAPRLDGATLQAAIQRSGVFHEAALAQGRVSLAQTDMKSALLALRQTLTSWLGQQAPVNPVAPIPPPMRGSTPRAKAGEPLPVDTNAPAEQIGKQLLERTESALARLRLHQHASLPEPAAKTADWSMDLPVTIGAQQTLMQIQIHRDQQGEAEAAGERGWQMRFAIGLPDIGEVGAQVTLRAGTTGVMLWATEPRASAALEDEIASLRDTLAGAGLRLGAIIVRHGEPPVPATVAASGRFVDARS